MVDPPRPDMLDDGLDDVLEEDPSGGYPLMDHTAGGRKDCQFSPILAEAVLERLAAGWTVAAILALPDMPSRRTLYDWRRRHPQFDGAWLEIRAGQAQVRRRALTWAEDSRAAREAAAAAAEGRRPRRKAGRRSTYTPQRGLAFCDLLLQGLTLREIAARPGAPAVAMVYRWLRNHPPFRDDYVLALEMREEAVAAPLVDALNALLRGGAASPGPGSCGPVACGPAAFRPTGGRVGQLRPDVWLDTD